MTAPVEQTPRRSPVVFAVIGVAAIICGIANVVGSQFFPSNAPVEQLQAFGFTFDYVALVILAIVGVLIARQPLVVRPSSVLALIGMVLTALVLSIVLFAWAIGVRDLASGIRLHYSDETWMSFLLAPLWITGIAFCGFAYRRGGTRRNTVFALLGIGFGIAIFGLAALSAVLYGLGLTT